MAPNEPRAISVSPTGRNGTFAELAEESKMRAGIRIAVVHAEDDFCGLDIRAESARFAGSALVYADHGQLHEFARAIAGFPAHSADVRSFEFGSCDPGVAGGYVKLELRCIDAAGHAEMAVLIEDDSQFHAKAQAEFTVPIEAAAIDSFVRALHTIDIAVSGEATLKSAI